MGRAALFLSVLGLGLLLPGFARADNFEEFGFGARAQAMGGAFTALADDATATYYNPAGLIRSEYLALTFGFSFADYALTFDSDNGGELDDRAERIPDLSAFTLGLSTTIPIDVPDRLGFGLGLFLPTRGLINMKIRATATEPEWFRYGRRHDRVHILPALAVKLTNWLSVGLGASIFTDAIGGTTISAGVGTGVNPSFELKLKPDAGVVFGFLLRPHKIFSFGFTYRSEVSFKLDFPANAVLQGISIPLQLEAITFFSPHQIQFGVAITPTDSLRLAFDFSWVNWSAYDDPFLVVSSSAVATLPRQTVDFEDVFSPKLGVEFQASTMVALRGGYWYRTTAVPDQDNEVTNLAGSSKHVFTLGVGLRFGEGGKGEEPAGEPDPEDPPPSHLDEVLAESFFHLDLFVQIHLHTQASASRPASDPVGSWDADGQIYNFGFTFTAKF